VFLALDLGFFCLVAPSLAASVVRSFLPLFDFADSPCERAFLSSGRSIFVGSIMSG